MFLFHIISCGELIKVQPVKLFSCGSCYKAGASEKFQKCFRKSLEGERESEREGGREKKNLSFDSLLIWDNLNPALMQIQRCGTTQSGPAPHPKQICGELKARMADSEPDLRSLTQICPAVAIWAMSARDVFMQ